MKLIDLAERRFGRLVVLERAPDRGHARMWLCRCDCGAERTVRGDLLRRGETTSCGCFQREAAARRHTIHGHARKGDQHPLYALWRGMRQRCSDPRHDNYAHYGGRGIKVCGRWDSFENFVADVGPRPSPAHSLDRIDGAKDYEPGNVRWSTQVEQTNNVRSNHRITANGFTLTVAQWSRRSGINRKTITTRLRLGWDPARAVTEKTGA